MNHRSRRLLSLLLALGLLAVFCVAGYKLSWQNGLDELSQYNRQQLQQFVGHIESQLARYEFLPELVAKNSQLVDVLNNPHNATHIGIVNQFLHEINRITGASDTYLMNREGLTLAASNWQSAAPFVGRNFSFRPYFIEAMKGKLGRYFALGTTSLKRGYYFAYPIVQGTRIIGVIVIKMDLSDIEQRWADRETRFLVSDRYGVVFITTHQPWLYHTTKPLDEETRIQIINSRQYGDEPLNMLTVRHHQWHDSGDRVLQLSAAHNNQTPRYLATSHALENLGWEATILSPLKDIQHNSLINMLLLALGYSLLLMLGYLWWLRHLRRLEQQRSMVKKGEAW